MPADDQLREEALEDSSVCYEALASWLANLGGCPHRPHLPCYAALRVRGAADLLCPACRETLTVNETNGLALRQHSNEVMLEMLTVACGKICQPTET